MTALVAVELRQLQRMTDDLHNGGHGRVKALHGNEHAQPCLDAGAGLSRATSNLP